MEDGKPLPERDSLFRVEAVLNKNPRLLGASLIYQPILLRLAVWLIGLLVFAAAILVSQINYKSTVPVRGMLNPGEGAASVNAPILAHVREILVSEGQEVQKGDVLARLSTSLMDPNGNEKNDFVTQQLIADKTYSKQEFEFSEKLFSRSIASQIELIEAARTNMDLLNTESNLLEAQILLSEENLNAQMTLLRDHSISQMEINRHQANHSVLLQRGQDIQIRLNKSRAEYAAARNEKLLLQLEHDKSRLQFKQQSKQLEFRIRQARDEKKFSVVAPADGIITAISAAEGQMGDPRQALMYLMPKNYQLEATLFVPSGVIGKISPGQAVQINYDSYNFREYGYYNATVTALSQMSLDPREHLIPIVNLQEPVYRVTAILDQQYVQGEDYFQLRPGMVFDAHVVIAEMTVMEYLLKPLMRIKRKI